MRLVTNWRAVLRHAWSVRLILLAIVFTGIEAAWPYLDGLLPIPRGLFALLSGLVSSAALYARFIAQKPISGDSDADQ